MGVPSRCKDFIFISQANLQTFSSSFFLLMAYLISCCYSTNRKFVCVMSCNENFKEITCLFNLHSKPLLQQRHHRLVLDTRGEPLDPAIELDLGVGHARGRQGHDGRGPGDHGVVVIVVAVAVAVAQEHSDLAGEG